MIMVIIAPVFYVTFPQLCRECSGDNPKSVELFGYFI
jgi:hypothetical protein